MADFRGVFPAIITPLTPDGELNEAAFREVVEFNIRSGVHGFWTAGGTGESILLSDEENTRVAEIAVDQSRGRAAIIMHVGAPTTARSAKLAERAAAAGVDAICCVPPFFYSYPDDSVVEHYRVVAAAAGLPFFAYNLPQATGVEITPDLMRKIQDRVPQLAGLKHSAPTFKNVGAFAQMGLSCFTGVGQLLLPALTIGACGVVDGPPCVAPELWVEVWDAYHAGDMERARAAQAKAWMVAEALFTFEFHGAAKAMLSERLGIDCGAPRPPLASLTPEQRSWIADETARLGLARVPAGQPGG